MDPELAAVVPLIPDLPFDDLEGTRRMVDELVGNMRVDLSGVRVEDRSIDRADGALPVRIFAPDHALRRAPAVLSIHGGGFAVGSMALDDGANAALARAVGAVVVSVEYRLAPEHPFPAAADDCYAAPAVVVGGRRRASAWIPRASRCSATVRAAGWPRRPRCLLAIAAGRGWRCRC